MLCDRMGCDPAVDYVADNTTLYAQFSCKVGLGLPQSAQTVVDFNRIHF
jgi:hypothetical protein